MTPTLLFYVVLSYYPSTNNGHTSKSYDSDNFSAEESALVKEMDGNLVGGGGVKLEN